MPVIVIAPVVLPITDALPKLTAPAYVPVEELELVITPALLIPEPFTVRALVLVIV
ncbi:hypothetical protein PHIN6_13280 [Polynucleobacter sp. HIN6]|nr:hypothetical protein PHIN6_13280 [Polynucleobacter sp. HIN6]